MRQILNAVAQVEFLIPREFRQLRDEIHKKIVGRCENVFSVCHLKKSLTLKNSRPALSAGKG